MVFSIVAMIALLSSVAFSRVTFDFEKEYHEIEHKEVNIMLTPSNFVSLRGYVTRQSVDKILRDLNDIRDTQEIYFYIDTGGGSIIDGMKVIDYLTSMNATGTKINCIADKAMSMGFVFLQLCPGTRYTMRSSELMQHNIASGFQGELPNMLADMDYTKKLYEKLVYRQAKRMRMDYQEFYELTKDDWYMDGEDAVYYNASDGIANVMCHHKLDNMIDKGFSESGLFGSRKALFHKCPLIKSEIPSKTKPHRVSNPFESKPDKKKPKKDKKESEDDDNTQEELDEEFFKFLEEVLNITLDRDEMDIEVEEYDDEL